MFNNSVIIIIYMYPPVVSFSFDFFRGYYIIFRAYKYSADLFFAFVRQPAYLLLVFKMNTVNVCTLF